MLLNQLARLYRGTELSSDDVERLSTSPITTSSHRPRSRYLRGRRGALGPPEPWADRMVIPPTGSGEVPSADIPSRLDVVGPGDQPSDGEMWGRLSRNAASTIGATIVSLATGFLLMPYVVGSLGTLAFGIWVLANTVVGYLGLLDVGLSATLTKKSAELLDPASPRTSIELSRTVTTVTVLYVGIGLAAGLVIAAISFGAGAVFNVPSSAAGTLRQVLWIVGLQASLGFPMSVWNALICGMQDYHVLSLLNIGVNLLRLGLTYVILESGGGLLAIIWMGFGLAIVAWLTSRWWVRRRLRDFRIRLAHFDPGKLREVGAFSGLMLTWSFAGYAIHQADRILIAMFHPVAAITTYEVGGRVGSYSRSVLHSWLDTIFPTASALAAEGRNHDLQHLYMRATKYVLASYGAVVVPLLVFGAEFIDLWMGPGFDAAFAIMALLVLGNLYQSQNVVGHVMLAGTGQTRSFRWVMLAYPPLMVALGVPMTKYWGLPGTAGAVALTMFVLESLFMGPILATFGVSFKDLLSRCHVPVAGAAGVATGFALLAAASFARTSWMILTLQVGSTLVVYSAAFVLFGTDQDERRILKRRMAAVFGRGRT